MEKDIAFYWDIRQSWYALYVAIISSEELSVDETLHKFGIYLSEEKAKKANERLTKIVD